MGRIRKAAEGFIIAVGVVQAAQWAWRKIKEINERPPKPADPQE